MFKNLEVFRMAGDMVKHAGIRQSVIARNMANADTPGYAAQDIKPFSLATAVDQPSFSLRATRHSHLHGQDTLQRWVAEDRQDAVTDPNGNSVSIEVEMVHAVETKRQHDQALAIYRSSLDVLRSAIGRR